MRRWLLLLALLGGSAAAAPPKPFAAATPAALAERYAGRAYILAFWSVECPHCEANLRLYARLLGERPELPLVLVAADPPEAAAQAEARLIGLGLADADSWLFADPVAERLRYAVDRDWRGELPRTYLYDARHQAQAFSGRLDEARLRGWLAEQGGR